jgi:hypothetical protein
MDRACPSSAVKSLATFFALLPMAAKTLHEGIFFTLFS